MDVEKGIQDSAIRSFAEYIASPSFQRHFEQFFLDRALTFTDDQEHRLDYMEIYIHFQDMFNKCMEGSCCIYIIHYLLLCVFITTYCCA